jgi:TRAP-type transport system periplasmic protein
VFFYIIYSESYLLSKNKKVTVPADLKGMKIGCNGIRLDFVNKLGGAGVTDVPPTMYEKIQTGVTEGGFVCVSAIHDFKLFEVAKYFLDVPCGASVFSEVINKNSWNKISPKDQKIMMDLAPEASRKRSQALADANVLAWKVVSKKRHRHFY